MKSQITEAEEIASESDYKEMVDLLAFYSDAQNHIDNIEHIINCSLLSEIDVQKDDYARYQEQMTGAEAALEVLARKHPEWFAKRKSVKTPYGTVKFHASTTLEIKNEEASIVLLQHEAETNPDFARFVKKQEILDVEALEALDDDTLKRFRIKRVPKDNFSVVPAKVDMGKAVKTAQATVADQLPA